jgi:hypothetical protein
MRLALPLTLAGVAVAAPVYSPVDAVPPPLGVLVMPEGCEKAVQNAAVQQMRSVLWFRTWGTPDDAPLCAMAMFLDHGPDKKLMLDVDNNADIWTDEAACPGLKSVGSAKGYQWPFAGYYRGPRPVSH